MQKLNKEHICNSFRDAFYYDHPDLPHMSFFQLLSKLRAGDRYSTLVKVRLLQYYYHSMDEYFEQQSKIHIRKEIFKNPKKVLKALSCRFGFKFSRILTRKLIKSVHMVSGCNISPLAQIGRGFKGSMRNIGITAGAIIGKNVHIEIRVSISGDRGRAPKIGDNSHVHIGSNIIGGVKVGENVTIGSNSLVIKSIPDNCTVLGVPAKIVFRKPIINKTD